MKISTWNWIWNWPFFKILTIPWAFGDIFWDLIQYSDIKNNISTKFSRFRCCIREQNRSNAASGSNKISRNRNFLHNLQENKLGKPIWFWHFIQKNFDIILRNLQFRSFFHPLFFCRRQKNLKDEQEWRDGAGVGHLEYTQEVRSE